MNSLMQFDKLLKINKNETGGSSGTSIEENKTSQQIFKEYDQRQKATHKPSFFNTTPVEE
jgi:hypothetical protein